MSDDLRRKHGHQLLWFVVLWIAGVSVVGSLSYAIRFLIGVQ